MPKRRYPPPEPAAAARTELPTDTVCTIITRQSTKGQERRNVHSKERHPDELRGDAMRLGFAPERIVVLAQDMGISAYSTTIEDRPALHQWLHDDLPHGRSLVVLVSDEDRLFRDRTEIQVNRFIEQVQVHGGWVVCAGRIYHFAREMDREMFRMACKYGRQYIEHHIKGRLLPARARAAAAGRYVGGITPWGYVVDSDRTHTTYKHLVRYAPHDAMVAEHVFGAFLRTPNVSHVAQEWDAAGRVWPLMTPAEGIAIPPRGPARIDATLGGYLFSRVQAMNILTDARYLGYMVYAQQIVRGEDGGPLSCHAAIIDPEAFWWCYDRIQDERPDWAPSHPVTSLPRVRTRRAGNQPPPLAAGRIVCAQHGRALNTDGAGLVCRHDDWRTVREVYSCFYVPRDRLEGAIITDFVATLRLDEADTQRLAALAHAQRDTTSRLAEARRAWKAEEARVQRAQRRAMQIDDDDLARAFLTEAKSAKARMTELASEMAALEAQGSITPAAWRQAEAAVRLAERIRATFADWPHEHQARVIDLAYRRGILGTLNRRELGLVSTWADGSETQRRFATAQGRHIEWVAAEDAILHQFYRSHSRAAICALLPARTWSGIMRRAKVLGATGRSTQGGGRDDLPVAPVVVAEPANMLAALGVATIPRDGALSRCGRSEIPRR